MMGIELTWLGHGSWLITTEKHQIVLDPFLDDSPTATVKSADIDAQFVLVSHGHFDHVADVASIANRNDSVVIANFEIAEWFKNQHGVRQTIGMNLGGTISLPFGRVKMTPAWHSSQLPDGSYGGNPGGFLLHLNDVRIYFACDTALFGDMELIGSVGLDLAVLPIGDVFTMGPEDSVQAIRLLKPRRVMPAHYGTWPPIEQDANKWADQVRSETDAEPVVLLVGQAFRLEPLQP
jgi:L-ascorbate metabolism protein UlaG (beta-lactamase superfamily)